MKSLSNYLNILRGDIFKLLPMKEDKISGVDNHLFEYLESLTINMRGALIEYSDLNEQKKFLYTLNNLQFLLKNDASLPTWRKIILSSSRDINKLCIYFGGTGNVSR